MSLDINVEARTPKCYFSNNKSVEIFSVDLADNTNVDHEDRVSVLEQKVFEPV